MLYAYITRFEVESHEDLSSKQIPDEVKSFARRTSGYNYSVIVITSHGDENDQNVTHDDAKLSAQDLVEILSDYSDSPKIVILQYCRSPKKYNRLAGTHENKIFKTAVREEPKKVNNAIVFPRQNVVTPRNAFMVYSTTSNSRSERGLLFKRMKMELYGMWEHKPRPKTRRDRDEDRLRSSVRDKSLLYQHVETVDTLSKPLYLQLYRCGEPDAAELFELSCDMLD